MKTHLSFFKNTVHGIPLCRTTHILLTISEKNLVIGAGKKWGSSILIKNMETYHFEYQEITNGAIANPSVIVKKIKDFIKSHAIKKAKIWASAPFLQNSLSKQHAILQTSLILSKAGYPLVYLTTMPIMNEQTKKVSIKNIKREPNLLQSMLPFHYQTAYWWLAGATIACLGLAMLFYTSYKQYNVQKEMVTHAFCSISYKTQNTSVHEITKRTRTIETETKTIEKTLGILKENSKSPQQLDMLISIAQAIPIQSWIENLSLTNTSTQEKQEIFDIDIKGNTTNLQEISDFITKLALEYSFNTLRLEKIQQQESTKKNKSLYTFVIKGKLGIKKKQHTSA